jgi:hypothetical protein
MEQVQVQTRAQRSEKTAETLQQRADEAQHQPAQPVYIEPGGTQFEGEARRAAVGLGERALGFQPSKYQPAGKRADLGPDLSARLSRQMERGGEALPAQKSERMRGYFHRNFDSVRLVDNAESHVISDAIGASAFTVGPFIFFGAGQFSRSDPRADRVLAHELTHVIQQARGRPDEYVIQRNDPPGTPEEETNVWEGTRANRGYKLDFSGTESVFSMPVLHLPKINGKIKGVSRQAGIDSERISAPFEYTTRNEDRDTAQRDTWKAHIQENNTRISAAIDRLTPSPASANDSDPLFYLKINYSDQILSGRKSALLQRDEFLIPTWNDGRRASFFDVDHYREHQLGGEDVIGNMWLLKDSVNRSAGSEIRNTVLAAINELFRRARADNFFQGGNASRDVLNFSRTPRGQRLRFERVTASDTSFSNADLWTAAQIKAAKHIRDGDTRLVRSLTLADLRHLGLVAGPNGEPPTTVLWFLGENSGFFRRIDLSDPAAPKHSRRPIGGSENFIKNFTVETVSLNADVDHDTLEEGAQIGYIRGRVEGGVGTYYDRLTKEKVRGKRIRVGADIDLPLRYSERFGYGAYIDRSGVRAALMAARAAEAAGLSPLAIDSAGLQDDWSMGFGATLTVTHPMFAGLQAHLGLTRDGVALDVDIPTDRLDFGFFRITEANLSVALADEGLLFGGAAAFLIPQIGSGRIVARGDTFEGSFDFDFDFVNPATVTVRYENESWSFGADLGITEGVVPGLKSGTIHVGIEEDGGLRFDGDAQIQLPGQTEPVGIEVSYSEEEGVRVAGTVTFDTSRFPAIENATVTVRARYDPETGNWGLGGAGSADFALPGVTGTLTAIYQDGGIIFLGEGNVSIGNATGTFDFTVGNYPITEAGEFDQSADPTQEFHAWGGGSVSITFGDYITGTVGIRYTPEDTIELMGGIALPPSIPLFQVIERERELLPIPRVNFPIFGVSIPVVGSIGVFGFIGGRVIGYARIGPASIDDTAATVAYTLGDPDSTVIHGESHLNLPMAAGVKLDIGGGLGLGAAIADLTGEVGIQAALNLSFNAGGDLTVDWTPRSGLALELDLHAEMTPRFAVGVYGRVAVRIALYGEVWSERWDEELASFGAGLAVSVAQPATWDEQNGLQLDFSRATFTYPDFNIREIAADIMDQIV